MSHPGASAPHPRPHRRTLAMAAVLVGAFLVMSLPAHLVPLRTGIDPSYWYGLNLLVGSEYRFGSDVVFTYGPLGYLMVPMDVQHNLLAGLAVWLLLHAALGVLLVRRSLTPQGLRPVAVSAALLLAALALGLPFEYRVVLLIGLLLSESLDARRWPGIPAAAAGVLTAAGFLAKFALGVSGIAMLVICEAVRLARRRAVGTMAATAGGFLVPLVVLVLALIGGLGDFRLWFRNSWELASDYGVAMSLPGYWQGVVLGLVCLACFAVILVVLLRKRAPALPCALIFSIPMLLSFKHGFTRQDGHIENFFSFFLVVLAALALRAKTRKGTAALAGLGAAVTVLALGAYAQGGFLYPEARLSKAAGLEGLRNLAGIVRLGDTRARLRREGEANLESVRLPDPWSRTVEGRRTGVFPSEISYAAANGFHWVPNPVLQSYSAYTQGLDRQSAAHLAGSGSPEFLIYEFRSVDLRQPFLDPPATVRAILQNFELRGVPAGAGPLLLEKTPLRFRYPVGNPEEVRGGMGEWVSVPERDVLMFAELHFRMSMAGHLKKLLFRGAPVSMEVAYESGRTVSFRIVPGTTPNGLLLNYLPRSQEGAVELWQGGARDRVVRFRVGGSGSFDYDPDFRIVWKATDYPVRLER